MPLYGVEFGDQLLGDRGRFLMFTLVEPAKRGPNLHCFIGLRWTDSNDRACQRLEASGRLWRHVLGPLLARGFAGFVTVTVTVTVTVIGIVVLVNICIGISFTVTEEANVLSASGLLCVLRRW